MHRQIFLIALLSAIFCQAEEFKSYKDAIDAGQKEERANKRTEAIADFEAAVKLASTPQEKISALNMKADCQIRAGKPNDVAKTLEVIIAMSESSPEEKVAAQLKIAYSSAKKWLYPLWETQIALAQKALAMPGATPQQQAEGVLMIAKAQEELDKYEDAIPSFEKVVAMNEAALSVKTDALNHIGSCCRTSRNIPKALAAYEQILKLPGASPEIIANAWLQSGDTRIYPVKYNGKPSAAEYAAAVKDYEKVLSIEKLKPEIRMQALLNIGNCAFRQGNYPSADKLYKQALAESTAPTSKTAEIQNQLAESYVKQKQYAEAFKEFEKTATMEKWVQDKIKTATLKRIAELYLETADYRNAKAAFEKLRDFPKVDSDEKKKAEQRIAILEWRLKRNPEGTTAK